MVLRSYPLLPAEKTIMYLEDANVGRFYETVQRLMSVGDVAKQLAEWIEAFPQPGLVAWAYRSGKVRKLPLDEFRWFVEQL